MPIRVQNDLPVKEILEHENIFVMDEKRAMHQDIRPIHILILNLMPLKEETELQLLRSLSNTPLQVDVTFMAVESHEAKNTSLSHLNKFYETFTDIKKSKFDGMIITGAPVEQMPFEEVDYWNELTEIMDWTEKHVTSTIFLCWAAQASLYHFYGLKKKPLDKKYAKPVNLEEMVRKHILPYDELEDKLNEFLCGGVDDDDDDDTPKKKKKSLKDKDKKKKKKAKGSDI